MSDGDSDSESACERVISGYDVNGISKEDDSVQRVCNEGSQPLTARDTQVSEETINSQLILNSEKKRAEENHTPPFVVQELFADYRNGFPDIMKMSKQFSKYCQDFIVTKQGMHYYNGTYWTPASNWDFERVFNDQFWPDVTNVLNEYYSVNINSLTKHADIIGVLCAIAKEEAISTEPLMMCIATKSNGKICRKRTKKGLLCGYHNKSDYNPSGCVYIIDEHSLCGALTSSGKRLCEEHTPKVDYGDIIIPEELYDLLQELGVKEDWLLSIEEHCKKSSDKKPEEISDFEKKVTDISNIYVSHLNSVKKEAHSAHIKFSRIVTGKKKYAIIRNTIIDLSLAREEPQWNRSKHLLVRTNGVFDLLQERFIKVAREDMIYGSPSRGLKDRGELLMERLRGHIQQIQPDPDLMHDTMLIYSSCLLPYNPGVFFIMTGRGRSQGGNGKTALADAVASLLGEDAMLGMNAILTGRDHAGARPEIANMHRKTSVRFEEVGKKTIKDYMIKRLTGRAYASRHIGSNQTEIELMATFTILTNHRLRFQGVNTTAMRRRLAVLFFPVTFHPTQQALDQALSAGGDPKYHQLGSSAVAEWMREPEVNAQLFYILAPYAKALLENGLNLLPMLSETTLNNTERYLEEFGDEFDGWVEEHLVFDEGYVLPFVSLKKMFMNDVGNSLPSGKRRKLTADWFKSKLRESPELSHIFKEDMCQKRLTNGLDVKIYGGLFGCKYLDSNGKLPHKVNYEIRHNL